MSALSRHLSQIGNPDSKTAMTANTVTAVTLIDKVREAPSFRSTIGTKRSDDIGQVFRRKPAAQEPIQNIGIISFEQIDKG